MPNDKVDDLLELLRHIQEETAALWTGLEQLNDHLDIVEAYIDNLVSDPIDWSEIFTEQVTGDAGVNN